MERSTMATGKSPCQLCTPNAVVCENALAYVRYDSNSLKPLSLWTRGVHRAGTSGAMARRLRHTTCAFRITRRYTPALRDNAAQGRWPRVGGTRGLTSEWSAPQQPATRLETQESRNVQSCDGGNEQHRTLEAVL